MSEKVKRGLGLLVVAVLAWIVAALTGEAHPGNTAMDVLGGLSVVVMLLAFVGGLVLIAWGLLRD